MHILKGFLYVRNAFQTTNVTIYEIFCVIPPTYYMDWFEKYHHSIYLNIDDNKFYLQCMNGAQNKKISERQRNILLDTEVIMIKYKKIKMYHVIYIKVFFDKNVSYISVSTNKILNVTKNKTAFT